jgi:aldehyde:ferredoxin oxidoreductase
MIYENFVRVLYIDMANEKFKVEDRADLKEKYLGGVGIATALLSENIKPNLPPLDENQPIIFACGVLSNVYPVVTKTVAMFYSPLTKELGEGYAGGRSATCLFLSGYDAIVITGRAKKPTYISIEADGVRFVDARTLWDIDAEETGRIIREHEGMRKSGKRSIWRIGPAGENLVLFAYVNVDSYRHFGRLGLGAVFGSKLLKAICIAGDREIPCPDFPRYFKEYQKLYKRVTDTNLMAKYHDLGTSINIKPLNAVGALPTYNMQKSRFDKAEQVTGEAFAEETLIRKVACSGCPVGCIHIGSYRNQFDDGYEYEVIKVAYDYELIYALGSFLGISDKDGILNLIKLVEDEGLDAISTGVVLGWATEALSRGLISQSDTIVPLVFGEADGYKKAIFHISRRSNEFYRELGNGAKAAAKRYGGEDFAMQIGGNEMPGYHTGYGSLIGAAVGARHSHLCNAGYSVDQGMKEFNEEKMVDDILKEEIERCMLNSLTICLFARKIYEREYILGALHGIGIEMNSEQLNKIGRDIYRVKLDIKKSLGFKQDKLILPKRYFQTPTPHGILNEETAYRLMGKYQDRAAELFGEKRETLF